MRICIWHVRSYGQSAAQGAGPPDGGEVVPWLRHRALIGRVELYLITHDPAERVDLANSQPHVVAILLAQMQRLLRHTARDGPDVTGWTQRAPPCPRFIVQLNVTGDQPVPGPVQYCVTLVSSLMRMHGIQDRWHLRKTNPCLSHLGVLQSTVVNRSTSTEVGSILQYSQR